jgi:hypothetical protein
MCNPVRSNNTTLVLFRTLRLPIELGGQVEGLTIAVAFYDIDRLIDLILILISNSLTIVFDHILL